MPSTIDSEWSMGRKTFVDANLIGEVPAEFNLAIDQPTSTNVGSKRASPCPSDYSMVQDFVTSKNGEYKLDGFVAVRKVPTFQRDAIDEQPIATAEQLRNLPVPQSVDDIPIESKSFLNRNLPKGFENREGRLKTAGNDDDLSETTSFKNYSFIDDNPRPYSSMSMNMDLDEIGSQISDVTICDPEIKRKVQDDMNQDMIRALTDRLLRKDAKMEGMEEHIKKLEMDLKVAGKTIENHIAKELTMEKDLDDALCALACEQKLREKTEADLSEMKLQHDALLKKITKDLDEAHSLIKNLQSENDTAQKAKENAEKNLADAMANFQSHQKTEEFQQMDNVLAKLKEDLTKMADKNAEKEDKIKKIRKRIKKDDKIIEELKKEMRDKDEAIDKYWAEIRQLDSKLAELKIYEQQCTVIFDFFPRQPVQISSSANFFYDFYYWVMEKIGLDVANELLCITASREPKRNIAAQQGFDAQFLIRRTDQKILEIFVDGKTTTMKPRTRFSHSYEALPKENDPLYRSSLVALPGPDFKWEKEE